ncbi:MAG: hypothetical protein E7256_08705 [Lachnospiraceae bacterium]|nr:hypothetical protein [Lachnospiraceae bacterium]
MERTIRLYDEDSHGIEFEAKVLEVVRNDKGVFLVLNQTLFFPEGGGQRSDIGFIGQEEVVDVQEKDGIVYHKMKSDTAFVKGEAVTGTIDWEYRFFNMQQHSGEHIVSGLICGRFGYDNVGFHVGSEAVTMDFNGMVTEEELRQIEWEANMAVAKNIEILAEYLDKEQLAAMTYRSKKEIEGDVRIVTIPGYDCCACCAPHVERTGEIGMIKLLSVNKYKSGVRIFMLCGMRALEYSLQLEKQVNEISVLLSAKQNQVADAVKRLKEENSSLKGVIMNQVQKLILCKVNEIPEGTKDVCFLQKGLDGNGVRQLANASLEKVSGVSAVFSENAEGMWQYVVTSKEEDCLKIGKALNAALDGRGGGSAAMVQGSLKGDMEVIKSCMGELGSQFLFIE